VALENNTMFEEIGNQRFVRDGLIAGVVAFGFSGSVAVAESLSH